MALEFKQLTPQQVEAVCNEYIRGVEAGIVREHMDALARRICGSDRLEVEHSEPLLDSLSAERERLKALVSGQEPQR